MMQSSLADEQEVDSNTNPLTDSVADSDEEDCDESQVRSTSSPSFTSHHSSPLSIAFLTLILYISLLSSPFLH